MDGEVGSSLREQKVSFLFTNLQPVNKARAGLFSPIAKFSLSQSLVKLLFALTILAVVIISYVKLCSECLSTPWIIVFLSLLIPLSIGLYVQLALVKMVMTIKLALLAVIGLSSATHAQYVLDINSANPINGAGYRMFTVGNINSDFYQEVIMQTGFGYFQGGSATASGGAGGPSGNGTDPLGNGTGDNLFVGNASGNPARVIIWQRNRDTEMLSDFLKDNLGTKPRIMQTLLSDNFLSEFKVDMRAIDYNTSTAEAEVINKMNLMNADIPATNDEFPTVDWDMATDSQAGVVDLTAGQYTWASGSRRGGSHGTYTYANGGVMDPETIRWEDFFDTSDPQNVWSRPANKPQ